MLKNGRFGATTTKPAGAGVPSSTIGRDRPKANLEAGDDAVDADVLGLRNDLLNLLGSTLPIGNAGFKWQVGFARSGETIEVLLPGDQIRDLNDTLRPL